MMNLVVMLEASPDWIMLVNAITIKSRFSASSILMLGNPATTLGGLSQGDTLFLIGHANTTMAGDYNVKRLADTLRARGLPTDHRLIVLPSSCETAKVTL